MSIYDLEEKKPPITQWRHPAPRVRFDENSMMPRDVSSPGGPGIPVLMDWDDFEKMLIEGKFRTKSEAVTYCRNVYTLLYDPDDETTHWDNKGSWQRIRKGLFPEALAAFVALPHSESSTRVRRALKDAPASAPGAKLLKAGECSKGHEIKGPDDLATVGPDSKGRPRLGCIHCRRERSRIWRSKKGGN